MYNHCLERNGITAVLPVLHMLQSLYLRNLHIMKPEWELIGRSQLCCWCYYLLWSAILIVMAMFFSFLEPAGMSRHLEQGSL